VAEVPRSDAFSVGGFVMIGHYVALRWSNGVEYRVSSTYSDPNRASRKMAWLADRERKRVLKCKLEQTPKLVAEFRIVSEDVESCFGDTCTEDDEQQWMKEYDEENARILAGEAP
jgi:hypothetical protein